jgi:hypothetical protein
VALLDALGLASVDIFMRGARVEGGEFPRRWIEPL